MNLVTDYISDAGSADKERLVIKVTRPDDVGNYAVFHSKFTTAGKVSSKVQHVFWFPDRLIKAGDLVVLYTKVGTNSQKQNTDETTSHFFYWGLPAPIWSEADSCAVLLQVASWTAKGATQRSAESQPKSPAPKS